LSVRREVRAEVTPPPKGRTPSRGDACLPFAEDPLGSRAKIARFRPCCSEALPATRACALRTFGGRSPLADRSSLVGVVGSAVLTAPALGTALKASDHLPTIRPSWGRRHLPLVCRGRRLAAGPRRP